MRTRTADASWSSARPPRFRRNPLVRDVAFDPGRATAPRMTAPHMLPSTSLTASAPAMLKISWLNATPHTIAVYASPSPSPAPKQHSLACGRHPLPAPVFHRLDHASFAWRTIEPFQGQPDPIPSRSARLDSGAGCGHSRRDFRSSTFEGGSRLPSEIRPPPLKSQGIPTTQYASGQTLRSPEVLVSPFSRGKYCPAFCLGLAEILQNVRVQPQVDGLLRASGFRPSPANHLVAVVKVRPLEPFPGQVRRVVGINPFARGAWPLRLHSALSFAASSDRARRAGRRRSD